MKVLYNEKYGGFGISTFAALKLIERKNLSIYIYIPGENGFYRKANIELDGDKDLATRAVFLNHDHGHTLNIPSDELFPYKYNSGIPVEHLIQYHQNPLLQPAELRFDPVLIQLFEKYGSEPLSDTCAKLALIDVPKGHCFTIEDNDGYETIHDYCPGENVYYAYE